jgi:hypothetical protein
VELITCRAVLQGLAFLFTAKGGLGLSFEHGWGCVIQRLGKRAADMDAGAADAAGFSNGCVWSAPAFVRINNIGVGLTVGERRPNACNCPDEQATASHANAVGAMRRVPLRCRDVQRLSARVPAEVSRVSRRGIRPAGYDSLETVLVLPNRSHVSAFKRTDVDLSIDAGLVVGRNREVGVANPEALKPSAGNLQLYH